jgi:hypothetical protein
MKSLNTSVGAGATKSGAALRTALPPPNDAAPSGSGSRYGSAILFELVTEYYTYVVFSELYILTKARLI